MPCHFNLLQGLLYVIKVWHFDSFRYRPDLLDFDLLNPEEVEYNNQIAFDIAEKELGIPPEMNGAEMANCDVPDRLTLTSYLTKIYELLKVGKKTLG